MAKAPLILIVDDEPHMVHVLSVKLVQAGFRVACAEDGYRALQALNNHAPDLVIANDHMPDMNGRQLGDALFKSNTTKSLPIILIGSHRQSVAHSDHYPVNIRAVIGKPFRPSDVINQVAAILDNTHAREVA